MSKNIGEAISRSAGDIIGSAAKGAKGGVDDVSEGVMDNAKKLGDASKDALEGAMRKTGQLDGSVGRLSSGSIFKGAVAAAAASGAVMQFHTQSSSECMEKCKAKENNDVSKEINGIPEPNCPLGDDEPECESYCKDACSLSNRQARADEKCSGVDIVGCTVEAAGGTIGSAFDFWDEYGNAIKYGLFILSGFIAIYMIYVTVVTFTKTVVTEKPAQWRAKAEKYGKNLAQ